MAGAHFDAVLAEPFPVTGRDAFERLAFGPEAAVLVILDVFDGFRHGGDGNRARTERRDLHLAAFRRCALLRSDPFRA